jgi:hypothetical protein
MVAVPDVLKLTITGSFPVFAKAKPGVGSGIRA